MASSRKKLNAAMTERILKLKQYSLEFERVLRWLDTNNKEFTENLSNIREVDKNRNVNCNKVSKRLSTPANVGFHNYSRKPRVPSSKTQEPPTLSLQGKLIQPLPRKRASGFSFFENMSLYDNSNYFVEDSFSAAGHNGTPVSSENKTDPEEFKFSDDSTKHSDMKLNEKLNEENGKMASDLVTPGYVKQMINRFSAGYSNACINGIADGNNSEGNICSFKVPLLHSTRSGFKSDKPKPFHYPVLLANRSSIPTKPLFNKSHSKNCSGNDNSSLESNATGEVKDSIALSNGLPKESSEFANSLFSDRPDESEKHSRCIAETQSNGFSEQTYFHPQKCEEAENVETVDNSESSLGAKNGKYFLKVMGEKEKELNERCVVFDSWLGLDVPDEALGKIRSAIGKANLLTSKKFPQFAGLCHSNMTKAEGFTVTSEDLEGFWDLVMIQVSDVETLFAELTRLKQDDWKEADDKNELHAVSHKQEMTRRDHLTPVKTFSKKNNKPSDMTAEKLRLRAAMQAGRRQRKTSQNEEEVQIFVAEKN